PVHGNLRIVSGPGDGTVPEASPGRPATSCRLTTTPRLLPSGLLPSVLEFHQVNRLLREPGRGLSPPVQTFTDPGECGSFASHPSTRPDGAIRSRWGAR